MSFNDLPKINMDIAKSEEMLLELEIKFLQMVNDFQEQNNYSFKPSEIERMLIAMLKRNNDIRIKELFKE